MCKHVKKKRRVLLSWSGYWNEKKKSLEILYTCFGLFGRERTIKTFEDKESLNITLRNSFLKLLLN